jgi:hypothetical protein
MWNWFSIDGLETMIFSGGFFLFLGFYNERLFCFVFTTNDRLRMNCNVSDARYEHLRASGGAVQAPGPID